MCLSYLDAAHRALGATPPPSAGAPDAVQNAAVMGGTHKAAAMRKQRRRRMTIVLGGRSAARVPAQRRLGSQSAARVPVHQRLGPRRRASVPDTPRQPHRGPNVDADGFQIVKSRRHRRCPGRTAPQRHRPVSPELVGLCFNCLAHDHIAAQCRSLSHCFRCRGTSHRARACTRGRSPACKRV